MKVTTEPRDDHQILLTITFDREELENAKRRVARQYAKRLRFRGFRPGKAPYEVVVRRVGEETLTEEALDDLIEKTYPEVLEQEGIEPYAPGKVQDLKLEDQAEIRILIPLQPEVSLGDYRSLRVPYEPEEAPEEAVEAVLEMYRSWFADLQPVERAAQMGDVVKVNVEAYEEGKEDGEPLFADREHPVLLDEPREDEWPYPGFAKALEGLAAGDQKTLIYTYPDDAEDESLQGKTVVFKVEVTEVQERKTPDLEELASRLGMASAEALQERVREQIQEDADDAYAQDYLADLLERIEQQAEIKYPPQMVEKKMEDLEESLREREQMTGDPWEKVLEDAGFDPENFEEELREEAETIIRHRLILETIAKQEELQPDLALVEQKFRQLIAEVTKGISQKQIRRFAKNKEALTELYLAAAFDVMLEQAAEWLVALAKGELDEEEEDEAAESEAAEAEGAAPAPAEEAPAPADEPAEGAESAEAPPETPPSPAESAAEAADTPPSPAADEEPQG